MKQLFLLSFATVLLLFLTACGSSEPPPESAPPASSESEASNQTEAPASPSKSNDPEPNTKQERDADESPDKPPVKTSEPDDSKEFRIEAYSTAIEDAIDYANKQAEFQNLIPDDPSTLFSDLGGLGYSLYDLDGTGAPELLIGFNDDQDIFVQQSILLIYTLENNQPKRLFESWIPVAAGYYNRLMLHEGNIICHNMGEECYVHANNYYRVSNGSAQLIEFCADICDPDEPFDTPSAYLYSTTVYTTSVNDFSDKQDQFDIVDEATVESTTAKYGDPIPIDYTPLTDLN